MRNTFSVWVVAVVAVLSMTIINCTNKDKTNEAAADGTDSELFSFDHLPKNVAINNIAQKQLATWEAYQEHEENMSYVFNAKKLVDLDLALDEAIRSDKAIDKSDIPADFNTNRILSRLKVRRTYLLQMKAYLGYQKNIDSLTALYIEANNSLNRQFNEIVKQPIDIDPLIFKVFSIG